MNAKRHNQVNSFTPLNSRVHGSKMKKTLNILISFFLILTYSSCTKDLKTSSAKILNLYTVDVPGFDPLYTANISTAKEVAKVYEGLLQYHYLDRPYQLEPNLAEAMPTVSKDLLTYTFKIKKGVTFHDDPAFPNGKGRELKASDFVYSLKRVADLKLKSSGWWLFDKRIVGLNEWRNEFAKLEKTNYEKEVPGLKALGPYTLQFKLTKKYPQFLYALAMAYSFVVPREAVEKYGQDFNFKAVGTGPFTLKTFVPKSHFHYLRNPNFRPKFFPTTAAPRYLNYLKDYSGKKLPLVDEIKVKVIMENQTQWLNFLAGKIDYLDIPKDNFESSVISNKLSPEMIKKGIQLEISPSQSTMYIAFNQDKSILKNLNLRRAISLSIDIDKYNKLFYNNTGLSAQSVIPPGLKGHDPNFKNRWKGKNLLKAKEYLKKAGYPNGKGLPTITIDTRARTGLRQKAEFMANELKSVGIPAKVVTSSYAEFKRRINNREVMLLMYGWIGDYPDAENFLQLLYGQNLPPGTNYAGYNNPEFNRIYAKATIMPDTIERTKLYKRMNTLVAEQLPWVFTIHMQEYYVFHKHLKNFLKSDFIYGFEQYLDVVK
jgi:oligopeptide transport system substrate-binding protein